MEKPAELIEAEVIEVICQRYHVTPEKARRMDVSVVRHLAVLAAGHPPEPYGE